ncbi:MAG: DNA repair protein RadA [Candidatus Roizmanbacteria bacterium]|nr:MAG: DNA repair protein RadA [Candidatus Roizmanbacteria bacterium]
MMYICSNCGYGTASWMGRCPECAQWKTFKKQRDMKDGKTKERTARLNAIALSTIKPLNKIRKKTGIFEFDRVLGGGFIPGEVVFLTGEPGVGKSTLLLQALTNFKTLYISGEEAAEQIKHRAERLKINLSSFLFSDTLQVEGIVVGIDELKDKIDIIVIDSIQTIYSNTVESPAGSVTQLKECLSQLTRIAKTKKIPIIVVGHVTKEGDIAGPKTLEHMTDAVLSFEGERVSNFRILRSPKNRFGPTDEIGIFEMAQSGLVEVNNPLAFLENQDEEVPGKAIVGVAEGKRSLFFEIQTLASPTMLPVPRRVVKGVDYNKVLLLLAVLRKHINLPLDTFDIYVNVVGGVDIKSTAADLGIIASLISSIKNIPVPKKTLFVGEVGLLGEVRKTAFEDKIVNEAGRLSFKKIISQKNMKSIKELKSLFK